MTKKVYRGKLSNISHFFHIDILVLICVVLPLQIVFAWCTTLLNSASNCQMTTYGVPFLSYGSAPYYQNAHITEPSPNKKAKLSHHIIDITQDKNMFIVSLSTVFLIITFDTYGYPRMRQPACYTFWRTEEELSPRIQFLKKTTNVC